MPLILNTNSPSLNAQRNLNTSGNGLASALQRLSSGLRINSAKDDAAGLAISERMTSQVRGQQAAVRNANDAVSLAQTAEGALQSSSDILQRIRELAVQSANATNSASDRQALNAEVNQLTQELQRIASTAEFNGIKLFDGTESNFNFQVGANAGQIISASTTNLQTSNYGIYKIGGLAASTNNGYGDLVQGSIAHSKLLSASMAFTFNNNNGVVTLNSQADQATISYTAADSAESVASKINATGMGLEAKASTDVFLGPDVINSATGLRQGRVYSFDVATSFSMPTPAADPPPPYVTVSFKVGGEFDPTNFYGVPGKPIDSREQLQGAVDAFNSVSNKTGFTADIVQAENGGYAVHLSNSEGKDLLFSTRVGSLSICDASILDGDLSTAGGVVFFGGGTEQAPNDWTFFGNAMLSRGKIELQSENPFSVDSSSADFFKTTGIKNSQLQSVSHIDVSTYDASQRTLAICDGALSTINMQRAKFGAIQSRLETTISNLQTSTENLSASRSRIQDADFAAETAALSRQQILQQAGTAMLAQANQIPQQILTLLK